MKTRFSRSLLVALVSATSLISVMARAEEWPQLQGDALRSGNAAKLDLANSIGLVAAIPLTDGIVAAPVVSGGKAIVIDGSGVVFAIDTATFDVTWQFKTRGGAGNLLRDSPLVSETVGRNRRVPALRNLKHGGS